MRKYEMMMILDVDAPLEESKKFVHDTFKANKVNILNEKDMGQRELAYTINKKKRGHYLLMDLEAEQTVLTNIAREFKLNSQVMRQIFFVKGK